MAFKLIMVLEVRKKDNKITMKIKFITFLFILFFIIFAQTAMAQESNNQNLLIKLWEQVLAIQEKISQMASSQPAAISGTNNCSDTDGGKDYFKKGSINYYFNGQFKSLDDSCKNEFQLAEYYCNSGSAFGESKLCENGCIAGACKNSSTSNLLCSDSDNGKDYYTRGYIKYGENEPISDTCSSTNSLIEYYCDASSSYGYSTQEKNCDFGCFNGLCYKGAKIISPVFSDDGNTKIERGKTYDIKWTSNGLEGKNVAIKLFKYNSSGEKIQSMEIGTVNSSTSGDYFSWTIPINTTPSYADNLSYKIALSDSSNNPISPIYFYSKPFKIASCSDSDNGKDYFKKGSINYYFNSDAKFYEYADYCSDYGGQSFVNEFYCTENDNYGSEKKLCDNICQNGVCVNTSNPPTSPTTPTPPTTSVIQTTPPPPITQTKQTECIDSDGGENYSLSGIVSYNFFGKSYNFKDFCSSSNKLVEYYCSYNRPITKSKYCDNICQNGACVNTSNPPTSPTTLTPPATPIIQTKQTECIESDGGIDYFIKGIVNYATSDKSYKYTDYCNGSSRIVEYYCKDNKAFTVSRLCENSCNEGACAKSKDLFHTECVAQRCQQVSGSGSNICVADSDCAPVDRHYECVNQKCTYVTGFGKNTCVFDKDCLPLPSSEIKHTECVNQRCVSVEGVGENKCQKDSECSIYSIKILSPNGNESLSKNQTYEIKWESTGIVGNVYIAYLSDKKFSYMISRLAPNTGSYIWTIPPNLEPGKYKINIWGFTNDTIKNASTIIFDFSDNYFNLK